MKSYKYFSIEGDTIFGRKKESDEWTEVLKINRNAFNFPAITLDVILDFLNGVKK